MSLEVTDVEPNDIENLESGVEIKLKNPFYIVDSHSREKLKVEHVTLNSPSFYKKNNILQLRRLVLSKMMALSKNYEDDKPQNNNNTSSDNQQQTIEELKKYAKVLIYSGQFDEREFDKLRILISEILVTNMEDSKTISLDCLPCLVNTDFGSSFPFSVIHLTKLSATDFEEIMIEYIANFITASFM